MLNINYNVVSICGVLEEPFVKRVPHAGVEFYEARVSVRRTSGTVDSLLISVPAALVQVDDCTGYEVSVQGYLKSRHTLDADNRPHLELFVAVNSIAIGLEVGADCDAVEWKNEIRMTCFVASSVTYSVTATKRKLAKLTIALNAPRHTAYYVPLLCWGKNADLACEIPKGKLIGVVGRLQSRQFPAHGLQGDKRQVQSMEVSASEVLEVESSSDPI